MAALTAPFRFADAQVFHARLRPHGLRFRYNVTALIVDVDRLDASVATPFFSVGAFNLFSFDPRDHGPRDGSSLRSHIDGLHREAGLPAPKRIALICFPRILGFVFNPIATFCCMDEAGATTSVVYEVRNTFGESHNYLFPASERDGQLAPHGCDKIFYVSPFMDMALRYRFLTRPPRDGAFGLKIVECDRDGVVLTALMEARVFTPTRLALLARLARTPLAGFKIVAAIHWQALRLWLRGHRLRPRPAPPAPLSVEAPGLFTAAVRSPGSLHD